MERERLKSALETYTNIAVLLVAVAALCTFTASYLVRSPSPSLHLGLQRGAIISQIPKVDYHTSKRTLLIALSTKCPYCLESLPFYRTLVETNSHSSNDLRIVALFPEKADEVTEFTKVNGLKIEAVPEVQFAPLSISGTPSIILVNNAGGIDDFWIGKLGSSEAKQLMRSISSEIVY